MPPFQCYLRTMCMGFCSDNAQLTKPCGLDVDVLGWFFIVCVSAPVCAHLSPPLPCLLCVSMCVCLCVRIPVYSDGSADEGVHDNIAPCAHSLPVENLSLKAL